MNPVGILLAAGRGRRFDPSGIRNKLLQPLAAGEAVVVASARNLLAVLPRVLAVVRADDHGVADALCAMGCEVSVCADADSGMAASLVHALRKTSSANGWLIALGDMPHVQPSTIAALLDALVAGAVVAAPVSLGRRGNPVVFSAACLPALLALEGDAGARTLLNLFPVSAVSVADPGIFRDIDTPSDLTDSKTS